MNKRSLFIFLIICCISLSACSGKSDKVTEDYVQNMQTFSSNVEILSVSINAIDASSETASSDLLTYLDYMDQTFAQMASLEVPGDLPDAAVLADNAAAAMHESVSLYHEVYGAETYDGDLELKAKAKYDHAFSCVAELGRLLRNEEYTIPVDTSNADLSAPVDTSVSADMSVSDNTTD
ncbi:MAG: hypothetical protein K6C99_09420 [Lachnospiraceae bacterium]|nr:hypothetical protein [Lachnospiraceae bacterium]